MERCGVRSAPGAVAIIVSTAHLNVELKARCAYLEQIMPRLFDLGAQLRRTDAPTDVY